MTKTYLLINGKQTDLASHLSRARTIVTLGLASDAAYNVIALDSDSDADIFQCQFTQSAEGWSIQNGQWRTDCPKGILSRLQHACAMCMGRCVNTHPARPTYGWRLPSSPTLLNGQSLITDSVLLQHGDVIQVGTLSIPVVVESV